jgi:methylglutaconyl-CoA hydratase
MEPYVKQKNKNGIGYIEFFHPSHNSLPATLLSELSRAITNAGEDDSVKILVLQSGGDRTFCAGASFEELVDIENEESGREFFIGFANVINAMRKCPKFIIGRVQGKAIGGGVGLASATDLYGDQICRNKVKRTQFGNWALCCRSCSPKKNGDECHVANCDGCEYFLFC